MLSRKVQIRDINKWKSKNQDNYDHISKQCHNKEYEIFKKVISEIIREKKQALETDKEMKELEKLMAIAKENDQDMENDNIDIYKTPNTPSKGNASTPEISEDDLYE